MPALVAQPDTKRMFMARRHDQRLVKTPRYPRFGPAGQKVGEQPGEAIQFVHGRYDCPPTGKVRLEDGREADAAEILAWLESHPMLGDIEEGFIAVEPAAPAPSEEEIERIATASIEGDAATLTAMLEQERAGFNRQSLIGPMEKGLARIEELMAKLAAEDAAPAKPAKKPDAAA